MNKILLCLIGLGLLSVYTYAQGVAPVIKSQRCLGGDGPEEVNYASNLMIKDDDGGYVVASNTRSYNNGDVSGGHYDGVVLIDLWVAKLDSAYNIKWQRTLGGLRGDFVNSIQKTNDGGYVVTGQVLSTDGDVSGNHEYDIWVVKLSKQGQIEWQKCFGGVQIENPFHIENAGNNGFIIVGTTESTDGDLAGNTNTGLWILRIDSVGTILWQKVYASQVFGITAEVRSMPDGNFLIGSGKAINGFNDLDVLLLKLNAAGNIIWEKVYAEADFQYLQGMELLPDGSILLCGYTNTNTSWRGNGWLTKLNAAGDKLWQRYRGGSEWDVFCDILPTADNSILIGGFTGSSDSGIATHGNYDYWLLKYDRNGTLIWDKTYGGSGDDVLSSIDYLHNGDIVMYGQTASNNMDVSGNHGSWDAWLVKVSDANIIRGTIYYDINKNGIRDNNEPLTDNAKIIVEQGGQPVETAISQNGVYEIAVDTGTYSIKAVPFYNYHSVHPSSYQVSFTNLLNTQTLHFGVQAIPGKNDLTVSIIPLTPARPGFPVQYKIVYKNAGTESIASGSVTLDKDRRLVYVNSVPAETNRLLDHITWSFTNLKPADSGSVIINLAVDVNSAHLGDSLVSVAKIFPVDVDITPVDNTAQLSQLVTGSYDPNDKTESNGGIIRPAQVTSGEYLTYLIRFQNTGTDTAFHIFVRDTLENRLDWNSFQMITASHKYALHVTDGNKFTWTFKDILLVDSNTNEALSHGYIAFRIKPKSTLVINDTITNTASIYFDYNKPVVTNNQLTIVRVAKPALPLVSGLLNSYCSSLGIQNGKVNNVPLAGSNTSVSVTLDTTTLNLAADSSFSFHVNGLSAGSHTITITFTNAGGTTITTHNFVVSAAVTPDLNVTANITNVTNLTDTVTVTAVNAAGGGKDARYTFALDRNFTNLLQGEGTSNTLTIIPVTLAPGDNKIFVRMKTSETCYTVQTAIDSIIIRRNQPTGIVDVDNPGQVINVFPNPFSGPITVSGLSTAKTYTLIVYNLHGQTLYTKQIANRSTVNLTGLTYAKGSYWLSIYDERRKRLLGTVQLVKQ